VTLWGDLSLTDALVEVAGIVDTGREVSSAASSATHPISSGVVSRVLHADASLIDVIVEGETLEFTGIVDLSEADPSEIDVTVLLFLARPFKEAGHTELGFRIAAVKG